MQPACERHKDGSWIFNFPFSPFLFVWFIRFFLISRDVCKHEKLENLVLKPHEYLKDSYVFVHVLWETTKVSLWPGFHINR